ncbi:MAG: sigma 54-interacting transcriptional regulator [Planctomycetota bacterium]
MGRVTGTLRKIAPLLGESTAVECLREFIVGVSLLPQPVLLTGESGTGKGLAARKIHAVGRTARLPFIKISCANLATEELEQLLFGGVEGGQLSGVLRLEEGSTCYLSGVECMPNSLVKLLYEYLLANSDKEGPRLIFSSELPFHDLLEGRILDSRFLELISVYHMCISPLRERVEDIPVLCHYQVWLNTTAEEYSHCWERFEKEILPEMLSYPWPGNVAELIEVISEYCALEKDQLSRESSDALQNPEHAMQEFLREEFEQLYQELLLHLELEDLTGRTDLVLHPGLDGKNYREHAN